MASIDLPNDMIISILSKLPVKSLIRFKLVCKPWHSLGRQALFIHTQTVVKTQESTSTNLKLVLNYDTVNHVSIDLISLNLKDGRCDASHTLVCPCVRDIEHFPFRVIDTRHPHVEHDRGHFPFLPDTRHAYVEGCSSGMLCIHFRPQAFVLHNPYTMESKVVPYPFPIPPPEAKAYVGMGSSHFIPSAMAYTTPLAALAFQISLPALPIYLPPLAYPFTTCLTWPAVALVSTIPLVESHPYSGFGYDSLHDDYKMMIGFLDKAWVFSLKANTWTSIKDLPLYTNIKSSPVFLNGALHWKAMAANANIYLLVSFNLSDEKFGEIPFPCFLDLDKNCPLGVFRGCLSMARDGCDNIELWMMKDYGVEGSWTKLFNFSCSCPFKSVTEFSILGCSRNNEVLLLVGKGKIAIHRPEEHSFTIVYINGQRSTPHAEVFEESLVSPPHGGSIY